MDSCFRRNDGWWKCRGGSDHGWTRMIAARMHSQAGAWEREEKAGMRLDGCFLALLPHSRKSGNPKAGSRLAFFLAPKLQLRDEGTDAINGVSTLEKSKKHPPADNPHF